MSLVASWAECESVCYGGLVLMSYVTVVVVGPLAVEAVDSSCSNECAVESDDLVTVLGSVMVLVRFEEVDDDEC